MVEINLETQGCIKNRENKKIGKRTMHLQLSKSQILAAVSAIVLAPTTVQAATFVTEDSIDTQRTDLSENVTLKKFDPKLGDLESVYLELTGWVEGSFKLESLDAKSTNVTAHLGAEISLKKPDYSTLLVTLPEVKKETKFTEFDKKIDFAGTSGASFTGLSDSKTVSITFKEKSDLASFIATANSNTLSLPVIGSAKSRSTGSGNLRTEIDTFGGAKVKVVYNYTPPPVPRRKVPEPHLSLGVMAAFSLGLVATKKTGRKV